MKILQFIFGAVRFAGIVGIGALFIYIEWGFLRQDSSEIYNPAMHFTVALNMLTSPLFWGLLVIAVAGHFVKVKVDLQIGRRFREEWGKSEKDSQ